jgi:hypothetical protein
MDSSVQSFLTIGFTVVSTRVPSAPAAESPRATALSRLSHADAIIAVAPTAATARIVEPNLICMLVLLLKSLNAARALFERRRAPLNKAKGILLSAPWAK